MDGTLVGIDASGAGGGLSNCRGFDYAGRMTANTSRLIAILGAIVTAAALRLVPHPPNFTPIGAMALFGAAYLGRRPVAFAAPLGALLLGDLVIGFYPGMWVTYLSFALVVLVGWLALSRISVLRLGIAATASSILFFLVSNFGTWALSGMYPHTLTGLAACYVAAIPFFQNMLAGDLFFTALLFGGFALLERLVPVIRQGTPQAV